MKLGSFNNTHFQRGRPRLTEFVWIVLSGIFFESWLPGSRWRVALLRLFGAKVAENVVIKPRVRVKFPWKLTIDNDTWIGESVWIDNLAPVIIGHDVCISQGVYLCTGNHDWSKSSFDLIVKPIVIRNHVWLASQARLAPGTVVYDRAIVGMGVIISGEVMENCVYSFDSDAALTVKIRES